jgi:type IV pilus biogenesis protein CpaD/CtpE
MNSQKPDRKKPSQNRGNVRHSENNKPINPGRHEYQCTICSHSKREEIERALLNWSSPSSISKQYSVSRDSIYRHAHALGLMDKRRRNVRAALEKIIEKAGDVEVSATAVVSAVAAYAKINANGQWIERSEHVSLNELFDRMTPQEMENYAANGTLPTWFERTLGATPTNSQGGSNVQ